MVESPEESHYYTNNRPNSTETSLRTSGTKSFGVMRPKFNFLPTNIDVWRGVNKAYDERYTIPTVKRGGGSLMFWGCVSYKGTRNLIKIDGNMNAACSQKILEEKWHSSALKLCMGRTWMFQHDNDLKHKDKSTCHWLQQHKVLDWPAQSPDLSIEPLWGISNVQFMQDSPRIYRNWKFFYQKE